VTCVFCQIIRGEAPGFFVSNRPELSTIIIRPLNPVTEGHVLVLPRKHVTAAHSDHLVSAAVMEHASIYAAAVGPYNLITSHGTEATQTVRHLHLHVVPRRLGDGLALPWTDHA
jgi:histidine triad (HIT) family protein